MQFLLSSVIVKQTTTTKAKKQKQKIQDPCLSVNLLLFFGFFFFGLPITPVESRLTDLCTVADVHLQVVKVVESVLPV